MGEGRSWGRNMAKQNGPCRIRPIYYECVGHIWHIIIIGAPLVFGQFLKMFRLVFL